MLTKAVSQIMILEKLHRHLGYKMHQFTRNSVPWAEMLV